MCFIYEHKFFFQFSDSFKEIVCTDISDQGTTSWYNYSKLFSYQSNYISDANSPAFLPRLRSPALVHKFPAFSSTINIEYLVKNKTDLV